MLLPFLYNFGYLFLGHLARAFCIFGGCYSFGGISKVIIANFAQITVSHTFGVPFHLQDDIFNLSHYNIVSLLVALSGGCLAFKNRYRRHCYVYDRRRSAASMGATMQSPDKLILLPHRPSQMPAVPFDHASETFDLQPIHLSGYNYLYSTNSPAHEMLYVPGGITGPGCLGASSSSCVLETAFCCLTLKARGRGAGRFNEIR